MKQRDSLNGKCENFCKSYCQIQIGSKAKFDERMEFDVYKRMTKQKRVETLIDKNIKSKTKTA